MNDEKYVIFKREDFVEWLAKIVHGPETPLNNLVPNEVADAVVIRFQDVFSAAAFGAYADSVQSVLLTARDLKDAGFIRLKETHQLMALRDRFAEFAGEARSYQPKKIPD